jgi:hypothetical protein
VVRRLGGTALRPTSTYRALAKTIPYLAKGSVCPGTELYSPGPGPVYFGISHVGVPVL